MMKTSCTRCVLGTMTMAGQAGKEESLKMLKKMIEIDRRKGERETEVDSARMYNGGETEKLLGTMLEENPGLRASVKLATKANPWSGNTLSKGGLTAQLDQSKLDLKFPLDVFYLHGPDVNTKIEETLQAVNTCHQAGKFERFALSNFTAWETVFIYSYMKERGWVKPTIYQGMLNAITRKTTEDLLPCLRRLDMAFYAYNPLAGGMLTGKHSRDSSRGGRFDASTWGKIYVDRFMREEHFAALDLALAACEAEEISPTEAAIRWMVHHSGLDENLGDRLILGATNVQQLEKNLEAIEKGALPQDIVDAYNTGWDMCRDVTAGYSRGVSGSAASSSQ